MIILDALYDKEIFFNVFGGNQFTGYEVEIYNNETNVLHYSSSKTTYATKFNIEANTLSNGIEYRMRVRTTDSTEYSEYSDFMLIKCYTTPVCSINNLVDDNGVSVVNNQNYIFEGSFHQAESVSLKSYYYKLYDSNKNLIQEFNLVYSTEETTTQTVEGFLPDTVYYIELICVDQNDLIVSSGLIEFLVQYEAPRIRQVVDLKNDKDSASVKISSNMIQIIFKSHNEPVYINEQELDLRDGNYIYLDEQLNLTGNFTLKIYARALPSVNIGEEKYFLSIDSIDGNTKIRVKESEGRIHVYKILSPKPNGADIVSHYMSDVIENYIPQKSYLVIQINYVNRRIDIQAQVIEREND